MSNKHIIKCQAHMNVQVSTYIDRLLRDVHRRVADEHKAAHNDDRIAFEIHC